MSESGAPPRRRRVWTFLLLAVVFGIAGLAGLAWYVTTDSFQSKVRERLVAQLERVTGGRVELGGFHTIPFRLQLDVRDLTIHGREGSGEVPLAHVDRLVARIKITSILRQEVGLHSLVLDHPVFHVIVYPDGTTNRLEPKILARANANPLEQLFALSIGRLEIRQGQFLWNDKIIPLDFNAVDVSFDTDYALFHRRYDANLAVGKIDTRYDGYRPVAWKAEAHFALLPDALELKSLRAVSGRSHAEIGGQVTNFQKPEFSGQYDLGVDLSEVAPILQYSELRRGNLVVSGHGFWSGQAFSSTGKLQLSDFEWRDRSMVLRTPNFISQFNADSQRLLISSIQTTLFGGDIRGDMEMSNWLNAAPPGKRQNPAEEQKGSVRLKIRDLSIREAATALSSLRSLQRTNIAGLASGTVETRWRGSLRNAESQIALDVVPPKQLLPGQLPLQAHTRATYRNATDEIEFSEFSASTRATQLRASGTLSRRAALKLYVTSEDLAEWDSVVRTFGSEPGTAIRMHGAASFNGTATGRLSEISLAGKFQAEDFDVLIRSRTGAPGERIRGDLLSADVQLSPQSFAAHHGTLHRHGSSVNFSAKAGLDQWQFTSTSPLSVHVSTQNTDVTQALAIAGLQYPVTGKLSFSLQADGTREQLEGQGSLHLADATIEGKAVKQVDAAIGFEGPQVSLQDIEVKYLDAEVAGSGTYDFSTNAFQFDLRGNNFDLASIPSLQTGPLPVEGRLDFAARSAGTMEAPTINATIHLRELSIGHQHVGDYTFEAVTQGAELQLHGRSQFQQSELNIEGKVHLRDDWPANIDVRFTGLNVNPLIRIYLGNHATGISEAAGEVQVQGSLQNVRELEVSGSITDFFADLEHVPVRNNGPIHFTLAHELLTVQELRLVGEGTDLSVGGTAHLSGEQELALHAEGHADLKLLHEFDSEFNSSGSIAVDVRLGGTFSQPSFQGSLQVASGSVQYSDLPSGLSEINGRLVFNQDRLQIETLTARVGGGTVTLGGYATAYRRQLNFDLTMTGKDVRLRYPPGVSSMTNAQLRWSGTAAASTITGDATITKLALTPGFDFGSYLTSSSQTVAMPQANPLLGHIAMDVHIVTTPELQMQTGAVRLSGNADLHLRGTAAKPVLLGRADVLEGEVYFNGAKYRMERGDITFTNPVSTTAVLDLAASTRVRDYDITLTLNGPIDKLKLNYRSEPPLPQTDIISLLALGQTQEQYAQLQQNGQSPFVAQASSAVLAEAINSALSNRSQRLFGISHIKIDPQGINAETTPVQPTPYPAVTVEQQVRDNITLSYTTNVAQSSQQIIQGEYNLTRNLMVVGIRDYNGVVSFELRLRQRKR
jgi:translocation and assembly module TamB